MRKEENWNTDTLGRRELIASSHLSRVFFTRASSRAQIQNVSTPLRHDMV
jgi:hypothetical protein